MSKPVRIQLSRKKGWRMPTNTVVVARPSKWGNPFRVGQPGISSNAQAVARFRSVYESPEFKTIRMTDREALAGKNLACWCKPGEPCHADVLLEIANAPLPSASSAPLRFKTPSSGKEAAL